MTKLFCIVHIAKFNSTHLVEREVDGGGCVLTPVFKGCEATTSVGMLKGRDIHGLTGVYLGQLGEWFDDIEAKRREFWTYDVDKAEAAFREIQKKDEITTLLMSILPPPPNEAMLN